MEFQRLRNILVVLGIAVAAVWLGGFLWELGGRFSTVIQVFFLAWLVSFAISPLVRHIERAGIRRGAATGLVYAGLLVVVVLLVLFVVPPVLSDLTGLAGRLGQYGDDIQRLLNRLRDWLQGLGVADQTFDDAVGNLGSRFADLGGAAVGGVLAGLSGLANALLVTILTLVVSLYLVLGWDSSLERFQNSLPGRWGRELRDAVHTVEATFAGFLRGQLIESALYGAAVAVAMAASGTDFIAVVSIFSGLVLAIPFLGLVLGLAVPVLVALTESPVSALWLGVGLLVVQLILENLLKPRIMGAAVGVHPLVVIAGVLAGSAAAGFWGALFGVPLGALIYFSVRTFYGRHVARDPVLGDNVGMQMSAAKSEPPMQAASSGAPPGTSAPQPFAGPADAGSPGRTES